MPVLAAVITSILMILSPHQQHLAHCQHVSGACSRAAVLTSLPVNTRLTGAEATAWSTAALHALGAPVTSANLKTMADWYANEGVPHDFSNPLNLETPYGGSVTSAASGKVPVSTHIQAYPLPADFAHAFAIEMHDSRYPEILADLLAGRGLETSTAAVRSELGEYSGGGYYSIPAAYCPCGGG